jgi:hypothetical protein
LGNHVTLGDDCIVGHNVRLGDRATFCDAVKLEVGTIISAGRDPRGYEVLGFLHNERLMITAGCRTFSLVQARLHWDCENGYPDEVRARAFQRKLDYIAAEASSRGWL